MLVRVASPLHSAHSWSDGLILFKAAQEGKKLVVIGSSFISMELVVAVSKRKLASIDVIGMEEVPFEIVLGKEVGRGLQQVSIAFVSTEQSRSEPSFVTT